MVFPALIRGLCMLRRMPTPRLLPKLDCLFSPVQCVSRLLWWMVPLVVACASPDGQNLQPQLPSAQQEPPLREGCNPLGGDDKEDCFTPFPSSFYVRPDPQDPKKLQVNIPAGVLPRTKKGLALDPTPLNRRDGFSPATPLLAYFPSRIDETTLPGPRSIAESTLPTSHVQLIHYETGGRVPLFAEVDKNASDGERQALLIYPQQRLKEHSRYVVAIFGLRTTDGKPLPPLSGFAAIRDNKLQKGSVRDGLRARFGEIFARLDKQGLPQASLQLAWDFQTASDESITGRLVRMRDAATKFIATSEPMPPSPVTILKVDDKPTAPLLRQVIGTFNVPSYLTDDVSGRLKLGPDGEPVIRGWGSFPFVANIPQCAERTMGPLPVMIFGHGLFGGALDELDSGYQREMANRLCVIQLGTDWLGLAEADLQYTIANVISDFNNLAQLTERLQQAHINFAMLAKLARSGLLGTVRELQLMGRPLLDPRRVFYYGISNGGVQGLTQLALSPDLQTGCLNVPGGFWSHMLWRSADFRMLGGLLAASYPDPLERQLIVALSQVLWDYTDPATYAPHVLGDLLPGNLLPKRVLYQEGLGDAQVPNLATRAMVRTMGLSLLNQPVEAVFGVGQVTGPVASAYVQYDIGQQPRPGDTNIPPDDNKVHEAIRRLEAAKSQLQGFLKEDGAVFDTCGNKPCVFPSMP